MMFLIIKVFPNLTSSLLPHGTYWLFAAFCFLTALHQVVFMPETKGLSILQIRQIFIKGTDNGTDAKKDKEDMKNSKAVKQ